MKINKKGGIMDNKFNPGDKVFITTDTYFSPAGQEGVVHDVNFTEGLVSVALMQCYDGVTLGPILDFSEQWLVRKDEENVVPFRRF